MESVIILLTKHVALGHWEEWTHVQSEPSVLEMRGVVEATEAGPRLLLVATHHKYVTFPMVTRGAKTVNT
eukprot:m.335376 g.335376  ORF g.335376 m.335376 type:complete len:70 (+) comp17579_c0_seq1:428-637(+)